MTDEYDTSDEEDKIKLIRRATFGKQVENFLSSDIGRYLVAHAELEASDAMSAFKTCNPNDVEKVRELQNTILQADKFVQWLASAVNNGLEAIQLIEDRGGL